MGKYDPLRRYLIRQKGRRVELSFNEIERLIGAYLPKAALRAQWWDGGQDAPSEAAQLKAWLGAGYRARLKTVERVEFERL